MDMQTANEGDYLARNFFVTAIEKKVFARSNIGAIFVNKQQINIPSDCWETVIIALPDLNIILPAGMISGPANFSG